jgi:hypothetical protein
VEAIWHITKSLPIQTIIEGSESSRSKMEKTPITWTVPLALWLKSISNNDELFDHSKYLTHRPWLSDTATSYFMCPEKSAIMEYHEYQPNDEPLHFKTLPSRFQVDENSQQNSISSKAPRSHIIQISSWRRTRQEQEPYDHEETPRENQVLKFLQNLQKRFSHGQHKCHSD